MLAYHYTVVMPHLLSIIRTGEIRPATMMLAPRERPAIWLTTYEHYEPTARKGVDGGGIMDATLEEMTEAYVGLVRLGVDTAKLTKWDDAARSSIRMPERTWRALEASAVGSGSDPSLWWIHAGAIRLSRVDAIDFYDVETDTWHASEIGADGSIGVPADVAERLGKVA